MSLAQIQGNLGNLIISGALVPEANETYDLGSTDMRWKDLYLSGNTLYIGDTVLKRDEETGGVSILNRLASNVGPDGSNVLVPATLKISKIMSASVDGKIDVSGSTFSNVDMYASNVTTTGLLNVQGPLRISSSLITIPSSPLTSNIADGFQVSASSTGASSAPYYAFDKSVTSAWTTDVDTFLSVSGLPILTTPLLAANGEEVAGHCVDITLLSPVCLKSYTINAPTLNGPKDFRILGKTSAGVTWTLLDTVTDADWAEVSNTLTRTVNSDEQVYDVYRLLVTKTQIFATTTTVNEWSLFFSDYLVFNNTYVGIGTTVPGYPLQVEGSIKAVQFIGSGASLTALPAGQLTGTVSVANGGTGLADLSVNKLIVGNGTSAVLLPANLHWDSTSNYLGIGTTAPAYPLHVHGKMFATEGMVAYSDMRLKTNVIQIENALNIVGQLRGVRYDRIDLARDARHVGLIAQEVEAVVPEVVSTDESGMKSLAYGDLVAVLIEGMKEQQSQIEALKAAVYNK